MDEVTITKYQNFTQTHQLSINEYITESKINIDGLYIDRFWSNLNDNMWVYVDDELIRWMGYTNNNITKSKNDFISILINNFPDDGSVYKRIKNSAFKEIYGKNPILPEGRIENNEKINLSSNRTIHLIVTVDGLKNACMMITTEKAKQIRMYFLTLDKIFRGYRDYIGWYTLHIAQEEKARLSLESKQAIEAKEQAEARADKAEAETKRALLYAESILSKLKTAKIDSTVYIRADESSIKRHTTKNGGTSDEKKRKQNYKTGRTSDNPMVKLKEYPCHDYSRAEHLIKAVIGHCRSDNSEMYTLPYPKMKLMMDAIMFTYNCFTGIMNCIVDDKEQMISQPMNIDQAIKYTKEDDYKNPMDIDKLFMLFSEGNENFTNMLADREAKGNKKETRMETKDSNGEEAKEIIETDHNRPEVKVEATENKNNLPNHFIPFQSGKVKCVICNSAITDKIGFKDRHIGSDKHKKKALTHKK